MEKDVRICEKLNNKVKSVFIKKNTIVPSPVRCNGEKVLEIIKISRKYSNKN